MSRTIRAALVHFPDLTVATADQIYTRLGEYRYRYASGSHAADLTVDDQGLVTTYDEWRRTGVVEPSWAPPREQDTVDQGDQAEDDGQRRPSCARERSNRTPEDEDLDGHHERWCQVNGSLRRSKHAPHDGGTTGVPIAARSRT